MKTPDPGRVHRSVGLDDLVDLDGIGYSVPATLVSLGDGVPIPILHQFNYQPAFWRAVQRRLGGTGSGAA